MINMNTLGMNFFFNRSTTMVSNVTHSPPPLPPPRTVLPRHLKKLVLYNSLSFRFSPLSSVLSVFLLQLVLLKSSLNRYFFSAALFFPFRSSLFLVLPYLLNHTCVHSYNQRLLNSYHMQVVWLTLETDRWKAIQCIHKMAKVKQLWPESQHHDKSSWSKKINTTVKSSNHQRLNKWTLTELRGMKEEKFKKDDRAREFPLVYIQELFYV